MAVVAAAPALGASKKQSLEGIIPSKRPSKEQLLKSHNSHVKKQESIPDAPRPVKQPIMSEAYSASTKSIRDLEIMPLSQLRVESHHRGQGLVVKVISPPYVGAGAVSIVEDEFGNAERVAIYNQPDSSILSGVPEGCVVAIKEPYYKTNGSDSDFIICVDHPSDVVLLRFSDPIIPEPLRLGPLLKTANDWRTAGDTAFIEKDLSTAVFCYTEAIQASDDDAFRGPVFAKRAGTHLMLGLFDAAKADALASLNGEGGLADCKAYYTAGRAAYGLCSYAESRQHFEKALEISPIHAGAKRELERSLARINEEEAGEYDFAAMYASLSPQNVHLDRATFTKNTEVKESPHHGRGLFATRDLRAGDVVMVEKATLMPNQYEPARASAALYALMVRQLCENPSLAGKVLGMHAGPIERTGAEGTIVDGVPVVDVFLVEGVRTRNCFSAPLSTFDDTKPTTPEGRQAKGLWVYASYMNHSCVANTMRSFIGDMLISRATRDIRAGEEIFQQYSPVKSVPEARAAEFAVGWGFECRCGLCEGERRSGPAARTKRREVLAAVEKACGKSLPRHQQIVPDASIRQVDKLSRQLEDLHEPEVYNALPRLTLIYPCNWLVGAHRGRKNHAKVIRHGVRVLRNFGFFAVPPADDDGLIDITWDPKQMYTNSRDATLMTVHVVLALRRLAEAYEALGKKEMAERCAEAARFGYMMITGYDNDPAVLDDRGGNRSQNGKSHRH